jgi:hypothetical protein
LAFYQPNVLLKDQGDTHVNWDFPVFRGSGCCKNYTGAILYGVVAAKNAQSQNMFILCLCNLINR